MRMIATILLFLCIALASFTQVNIPISGNKIVVKDHKIGAAEPVINTNVIVAIHYDYGEYANLSGTYTWYPGDEWPQDMGPGFYNNSDAMIRIFVYESGWALSADVPYIKSSGGPTGTYDEKPYGGGGYIVCSYATE